MNKLELALKILSELGVEIINVHYRTKEMTVEELRAAADWNETKASAEEMRRAGHEAD